MAARAALAGVASAPSFLKLQHRFKQRRFRGSVNTHLLLLPLAAVLLLAECEAEMGTVTEKAE